MSTASPDPGDRLNEANHYIFLRYVADRLGAEQGDGPAMFWYRTGVYSRLFNGVSRLTPGDELPPMIAAVARKLAGTLACWWVVGQPFAIEGLLRREQIYPLQRYRFMAAPLDQFVEEPLPERFTIRRVDHLRDLESYIRAFRRGFGISASEAKGWFAGFAKLGLDEDLPLQHYVGFRGNEAVATSALFDDGTTAGLYNIATIPAARRLGYGRAMTIAPLLDARRRGRALGVLQATPAGLPLYETLGFVAGGTITCWG